MAGACVEVALGAEQVEGKAPQRVHGAEHGTKFICVAVGVWGGWRLARPFLMFAPPPHTHSTHTHTLTDASHCLHVCIGYSCFSLLPGQQSYSLHCLCPPPPPHTQVLNSFQMASLLVQAYPAVPDALAVASAVIADMNEKGQPLPSGLANLQGNQGLAGERHWSVGDGGGDLGGGGLGGVGRGMCASEACVWVFLGGKGPVQKWNTARVQGRLVCTECLHCSRHCKHPQ